MMVELEEDDPLLKDRWLLDLLDLGISSLSSTHKKLYQSINDGLDQDAKETELLIKQLIEDMAKELLKEHKNLNPKAKLTLRTMRSRSSFLAKEALKGYAATKEHSEDEQLVYAMNVFAQLHKGEAARYWVIGLILAVVALAALLMVAIMLAIIATNGSLPIYNGLMIATELTKNTTVGLSVGCGLAGAICGASATYSGYSLFAYRPSHIAIAEDITLVGDQFRKDRIPVK